MKILMISAAIISVAYILYRLVLAAYIMVADLLYAWIDPHAESGSLYRDYVDIGNQISKVYTFSDLHKAQRLVDGFAQAADGNMEAMNYAENLKSLLYNRELYLRRNAYRAALN